jgi:hypothetical protein
MYQGPCLCKSSTWKMAGLTIGHFSTGLNVFLSLYQELDCVEGQSDHNQYATTVSFHTKIE